MKISPQQNSLNFGNGTQLLRFLTTDPAAGAIAVDLSAMTVPRTLTDMKKRGPVLGMETAVREGSSSLNFGLVGGYGILAGLVTSGVFNNKYGIKAHKLFASGELIEEIGNTFAKNVHETDAPAKTLKDILGNVEILGKKLDSTTGDKIIELYKSTDFSQKSAAKELRAAAKAHILRSAGSETSVKLGKSVSTLDTFLDSTFNLVESCKSKPVIEAFKADGGQQFIKTLKRTGISRSLLGLGIACSIGLSIQPFINYLTKKRTGSDGFACADGRQKDNSGGFKALKTGVAASGLTAALLSIGKPSQLLNNLEFKGGAATIPQLKLLYGLTIASRLISTRDKDELRETLVRDSIGFTSWLILGNFVQKGVAKMLDGSLFKADKELKSRDEVIQSVMKKLGKETVENGKALRFNDMLGNLKTIAKAGAPEAKAAMKSLRALNIAQLAGYGFSCVALGNVLPRINIAMTKKSEAKRQAAMANSPSFGSSQYRAMVSSENIKFLSQHL